MKHNRLSELAIILSLVILSPVIFFGICEVTVRIFSPQIRGWIDEDPHGKHPILERIFRPNKTASYYAPDGREVTINTNSDGFRGIKEYEVEDTSQFRIAGLGDSFTFGSGVNDGETYLQVMEQVLNSHTENLEHKAETINMGVDTYGTIKERIFLELFGLKYRPDLITVGFLPNDLWDNLGWVNRQLSDSTGQIEKEGDDISPLSSFIGLIYMLKSRSHFVFWLGKKVMSVSGVYRFAYKNRPDKFDFTSEENQTQVADAYQYVHGELGRIKQLADSIDSRVVVISIPLPNTIF